MQKNYHTENNNYGLKIKSSYDVSAFSKNIKHIYNATGDIIITDSGIYYVYCEGDVTIHNNISHNLHHIICVAKQDNINIKILSTGETVSDQRADILHVIESDFKNVSMKIYTRGIATGNSKIIYRSNIIAGPNASGTGFQEAKFILMSQSSEIDAIPMLEIQNTNIPTSHNISISDFNYEHVFYYALHGYDIIETQNSLREAFLNIQK
jgi:Fe-S cluster assembly scaffold protein SufB